MSSIPALPCSRYIRCSSRPLFSSKPLAITTRRPKRLSLPSSSVSAHLLQLKSPQQQLNVPPEEPQPPCRRIQDQDK
ncbi:hypothetical protein PQX77_014751 [Marasmius sp. AFHP31]|nr:hypothetical protein PQX77_014751 [Marasmius sp. AFHP31]